jgi:hypothetical protein
MSEAGRLERPFALTLFVCGCVCLSFCFWVATAPSVDLSSTAIALVPYSMAYSTLDLVVVVLGAQTVAAVPEQQHRGHCGEPLSIGAGVGENLCRSGYPLVQEW